MMQMAVSCRPGSCLLRVMFIGLPWEAFKLPDQELCTEEHADSLSCVAAKGDDPTMYIAAAAGRAVRSHSTSVGLACWTSSEGVVKDGLRCALLGAEVVALAFLPGRSWLAGAVNSHAGAVCCVWNLSDSGCARLSCEVPLEGSSVRCLAIGYDSNSRPLEWRDGPNSPRSPSASARGRPRTVSKDPREAKEPRLKVKRLWHAGLLMPSGLEPFPSAVLASSSDACVVAHEVRTGFRTFFDISQEGEAAPKKGSTPLAATVLRFTASGRLLAAGDTAGRVHLFLLGRLVSSESSQMRVQAHRVLCLSGEVMDIVIKGEQLSRAVCCQSQREQEEQDANDTSAASAGASHDEHRVLVYDLLNPSLDFMLPDVKLKAEDATRCVDLQPGAWGHRVWAYFPWRGIYFRIFFVFFWDFFSLLASWLLGFLASWLLGFLASWLLGFSASWLLGFWASRLFGFLLVYAAFGGFLAFRILCIPSSSSAGGAFPTSWGGLPPPQPPRYVLDFLQLNHQFFEHHGGVAPLVESSILEPSWGGLPPPPTPPLLFRLFAEI